MNNPTDSAISAGELAAEILTDTNIDPIISTLGKDGGESAILEFKAIYTSRDNPDVLRWHVMKSIVAMANADGGCIIIGLDDDGATPVQWKPNLSLAAPEDKDYFEHARNFIFNNAYRTEDGSTISIHERALKKLRRENCVKFHLCRSQRFPDADFLALAVMPFPNEVIVCKFKQSKCLESKNGKLIKEADQDRVFFRSLESAHTIMITSEAPDFAESYTKYVADRQPKKSSYFRTLQKYLNASCPRNDCLSLLDDILECHVDISFHSFIQTNPSDEEKLTYLSSFSLVFAALGEFKALPYWFALTKFFKLESCTDTVKHLTSSPREIDVHAILKVLSSDKRRYAWCIDALMLGVESEKVNEKAILVATKLCKLFGYNVNELTPFLDNVAKFVTSSDPKSLFETIKTFSRRTSAWRTVLDFKRISLTGAFDNLKQSLMDGSTEGLHLFMDISQKSMHVSIDSSSLQLNAEKLEETLDELHDTLSKISEEDFQRIAQTPIQISDDGRTPEKNKILNYRSEELTKFKETKKQVEDFISRAENLCQQSNDVLHVFGTNGMTISNDLYQVEPDENITVRNENWEDHIVAAYERLCNTASKAGDVLSNLTCQIAMYERGEFDESYEEKEKRETKQRAEKALAEKEGKKRPIIKDASGDFRISLSLAKVSNIPFYPSDVRFSFHFSQQWFVASDKRLWSTHDLSAWIEHALPIQFDFWMKFKVLNNTLVLWSTSSDSYCFTEDGETWSTGKFPSQNGNVDFLFCNDKWLLLTKDSQEYSYYKERNGTEKKRSCSADTAKLYRSYKLGDEWQVDEIHSMRIGRYIDENASAVCNDKIVAIANFDSCYLSNNHMSARAPEALFAYENRDWEHALIDPSAKDAFNYNEKLAETPKGIYSGYFGGLVRTTDGITWKKVNDKSPSAIFSSGDLLVATTYQGLLISKDGESFSELYVDNDIDILALNGDSVIIVDTDPRTGGLFHGTFLREPAS